MLMKWVTYGYVSISLNIDGFFFNREPYHYDIQKLQPWIQADKFMAEIIKDQN